MPSTSQRTHHVGGMSYTGGHAPHFIPATKHHRDPGRYPVRLVAIEGRWILAATANGAHEWMWSALASEAAEEIDARCGGLEGLPESYRAPSWKVLYVPMGSGCAIVVMVTDEPAYCLDCPPRWRAADRAVRASTVLPTLSRLER